MQHGLQQSWQQSLSADDTAQRSEERDLHPMHPRLHRHPRRLEPRPIACGQLLLLISHADPRARSTATFSAPVGTATSPVEGDWHG